MHLPTPHRRPRARNLHAAQTRPQVPVPVTLCRRPMCAGACRDWTTATVTRLVLTPPRMCSASDTRISSCCARLFDCAASMTTDTCICAQDTSERSTRGETAKRFDNGGEACSRSRPSERGALPRISESELLHHAPESPTQRLQFTYKVCMCWRACVCDCGIAPASEHHLLVWHIPLVTQYKNYTHQQKLLCWHMPFFRCSHAGMFSTCRNLNITAVENLFIQNGMFRAKNEQTAC